jgi:hypothetical protein
MSRAGIVVEKWVYVIGWQYDSSYPKDDEDLAMLGAKSLEKAGVLVRVYRRTPEGPQVIYESPKP